MSTACDFSDAAAVRKLAGAGERLVCLQFPDGLGSLYCHSFVLSSRSTVLRNVLEDTQQQQGQLCTIPLAGDSNVSLWKLALGLMYRLSLSAINLENAQPLLLLAHKYDMSCITGRCAPCLLRHCLTGKSPLNDRTSLSCDCTRCISSAVLAALQDSVTDT
jgi:hypothetical protein